MSCDRTYGEGFYGDCFYGGAEPTIPGYFIFPSPNANNAQITTLAPFVDFTFIISVVPVTGTAVEEWFTRWTHAADGTRQFRIGMASPSLNPFMQITSNGFNAGSLFTIFSASPMVNATLQHIAFTYDADNGGGQSTGRLWRGPARDGPWTLAQTVNIAQTTPFAGATATPRLTSTRNGVPSTQIHYASFRSNIGPGGTPGDDEIYTIDGTELTDPNATSFIASTGQVVSVNRTALPPQTQIVAAIVGDCEPCFSNEGCPEQVPAASGPRDRFFHLVPCSPGGEC